jgi:hypothetical protein
MVDFSKLKKQKNNFLKDLQEKVNSIGEQQSFGDARYWQPTVDKAGNGYAVVRFLPAPGDETIPFARLWSHSFKGPTGQWYIENSLTTLGQDDPVSVYNSVLWNSTDNDASPARKQAREQKRKLFFIFNVLVVEDSANPENNGKVFLYKCGKKIFDKIKEAMNPQFADEVPMNPFDMWEGANFKIKIRKVEGYRNYDKSEFDKVSPISSNDDEIEKIWKQTYSLTAEVAPDKFKTHEELEKKLHKVLNLVSETVKSNKEISMKSQEHSPLKERSSPSINSDDSPPFDTGDDDDDADGLDYFKNMLMDK